MGNHTFERDEDLIDVDYESARLWDSLLQQNKFLKQFKITTFRKVTSEIRQGKMKLILPDIISFTSDGDYCFDTMLEGLSNELNKYFEKTLHEVRRKCLLEAAFAQTAQLIIRKIPTPACLAYVFVALRSG